MTTVSTTTRSTARALCLLIPLILGSCTKTRRIEDLAPQTGIPTITTSTAVPLAIGAALNVNVTGSVSVASTLNLPELRYENQLGVCVFNGQVTYSDALRLTCPTQASLPEGVTLTTGSTREVSAFSSGRPGQTSTFVHQTGLSFTDAGVYTVFGWQLAWTGSQANPLAESRRVTPQPLVITVQ
ncbi:hypothetical protein [Deinococcus xianganensis]|uniref:Uncharacterized protein n=1 Tax=Deinococcus xianganensis TaxID=1507289 RepID=A0A6I4YUB1_9DEIO|nr:hypothetical protein [Deinococcus xianganensis]MXV20703.1 hypothetical protein [Deinococcus xianganensis]